jgi:hypothetical protein
MYGCNIASHFTFGTEASAAVLIKNRPKPLPKCGVFFIQGRCCGHACEGNGAALLKPPHSGPRLSGDSRDFAMTAFTGTRGR